MGPIGSPGTPRRRSRDALRRQCGGGASAAAVPVWRRGSNGEERATDARVRSAEALAHTRVAAAVVACDKRRVAAREPQPAALMRANAR